MQNSFNHLRVKLYNIKLVSRSLDQAFLYNSQCLGFISNYTKGLDCTWTTRIFERFDILPYAILEVSINDSYWGKNVELHYSLLHFLFFRRWHFFLDLIIWTLEIHWLESFQFLHSSRQTFFGETSILDFSFQNINLLAFIRRILQFILHLSSLRRDWWIILGFVIIAA